MDDGTLAETLMAQAIDFHPAKDIYDWFIRARTKVVGGYNTVDTPIVAKQSTLTDREGALYGQAVQTGDRKITVSGRTPIDTKVVLVTKDATGADVEEWDVYYCGPIACHGVVMERYAFVRPRRKT